MKGKEMIYIGVDPGKSGAIAVVDTTGVTAYKMPEDVYGLLGLLNSIATEGFGVRVVIEKVHSMPSDGAQGAFTFGKNVGQLEGVLAVLGFPTMEATPQNWMKLIPGMPAPKKTQNGEKKTAKQKADEKKIRKEYIHQWVQKLLGKHVDKYKADAVAIAILADQIWRGV